MKTYWKTTIYLSIPIAIGILSLLIAACSKLVIEQSSPGNPNPITSSSPAPTVNSLTPPFAVGGSIAQTVIINGTGFQNKSSVMFNGSPHPATLISPQQLSINVSQSDLGTPGNYAVAVTNPTPGGGTATATFQVWQTVSDPITGISLAMPDFNANVSLGSDTSASGVIHLYPSITKAGSSISASGFFLDVYPNPQNLALEQWFEVNIDVNGELLNAGSYQPGTLADGRMVLINQSGAPGAYYAGGGTNDLYYAYAEISTGQIVAIQRSWEDDLYQQGYLPSSASLTDLEISVLSTVRY